MHSLRVWSQDWDIRIPLWSGTAECQSPKAWRLLILHCAAVCRHFARWWTRFLTKQKLSSILYFLILLFHILVLELLSLLYFFLHLYTILFHVFLLRLIVCLLIILFHCLLDLIFLQFVLILGVLIQILLCNIFVFLLLLCLLLVFLRHPYLSLLSIFSFRFW